MNTVLHFLLCQPCRSISNVSLGSPHITFLGLIKSSYHGWLSMLTSFEGPLSALPQAARWSYSVVRRVYLAITVKVVPT